MAHPFLRHRLLAVSLRVLPSMGTQRILQPLRSPLSARRQVCSASSPSNLLKPLSTITSRHSRLSPRASIQSRAQWTSAIGAEPGIDPSIPSPGEDRLSPEADVDIQVVDYSKERLEHHRVNTLALEKFLDDHPTPDWAACRWIYVNGLSMNVVRTLGRRENLHPLAIEDVLDTRTPTKVNWYEGHCYLEMNLVKLTTSQHNAEILTPDDPSEALLHNRNHPPRRRVLSPDKFTMTWEQMSAFMTSGKTIITIFERSGGDVLAPILTRLQSSQTVVRSSNDPSMLLQAVVDTVVDLSLPIGAAAAEVFEELEYLVLAKPTIPQSKQLHILRSGLTLLANNTIAIGSLVRTLCDHSAVSHSQEPQAKLGNRPVTIPPPIASVQISPLAQIYFQDVQDHIAALSNSTRMSIHAAENLSSLIFNTIAASQNDSVRKLTLVSSFFLPLTFLTGYFGMNFDPMPIVNEHSDIIFWFIASPVMLGTLLVLTIKGRWQRTSAVFAKPRSRKTFQPQTQQRR